MLSRSSIVTLTAIVAATSACGDSGRVPPEGAADAGRDAQSAAIRVTVFDETMPGTPARGARVIFEAPDRSIQTVFTDAGGIAEAVSPPGTTATAIQDLSPNPGKVFTSFRALAPGMAVVAGPSSSPRRYVGSVSVAMDQLPNGMYYEVRAPCADLIHGSADPMSVFVFSPCTGAGSATLVGRVRDANHQLLGVSVLDGVDLPTAIGGQPLPMPPYTRTAVPLKADIDNVPATVDSTVWQVFYKQHSDDVHDRVDAAQYLEAESGSASSSGTLAISAEGYPVGNETLFAVVMHPAGYEGAFSNYLSVVAGEATHMSFDAGAVIRAIDAAGAVTPSEVTWTESGAGTAPALVDVAVSWGDVHGTIYAPYAGASLSLGDLPGELISTDSPTLVSLATYGGDERTYAELVVSMREYASYWSSAWASAVPAVDSFWTSVLRGHY